MAMRISDWYTPINYPVMPPREQKGIGDALLEIAKIQQAKRAERRQQEEMDLRKQEMEERRKSLELERQAREMELTEKKRQQEQERRLPGMMDEAWANSAAVDPNDPTSGAPSIEMLRYDALMKQGRVEEAEKLRANLLSQSNMMGGEKTAAGRAVFNQTIARSPSEELRAQDEVKEFDNGDGTITVVRRKEDGSLSTEVVGKRRPVMLKDPYGGVEEYDPESGQSKKIKAPVKTPGAGGGRGNRATNDDLKKIMLDKRLAQQTYNGGIRIIAELTKAKLKLDPRFYAELIARYDAQIEEARTDPRFLASQEVLFGNAGDQERPPQPSPGMPAPADPAPPAVGAPTQDLPAAEPTPGAVIDGSKYLKKNRTPTAGKGKPAPTVSTVYAPDFMEKARQAAKKSGRSF